MRYRNVITGEVLRLMHTEQREVPGFLPQTIYVMEDGRRLTESVFKRYWVEVK